MKYVWRHNALNYIPYILGRSTMHTCDTTKKPTSGSDLAAPTNYIYLLQEREFIKTQEPVYKIGMTRQENNARLKQYPKGSRLLFQIICFDCKRIETRLIRLFKTIFIHRADIGTEYFEGDYACMLDHMYAAVKTEGSEPVVEDVDASVECAEDKTEPDGFDPELTAPGTMTFETDLDAAEYLYEQMKSEIVYSRGDTYFRRDNRTWTTNEKSIFRLLTRKVQKADLRSPPVNPEQPNRCPLYSAILHHAKDIAETILSIVLYNADDNFNIVDEADWGDEADVQLRPMTCADFVERATAVGMKIMITNKRGKGYYKFPKQSWHVLIDDTHPDFGTQNGEDLMGFVRTYCTNERHDIRLRGYDDVCIINDKKLLATISKVYYNPKPSFYTLNYYEYVVSINACEGRHVFNSRKFSFTPLDEFESAHGNVLDTNDACYVMPGSVETVINTDVGIVDTVLQALINTDIIRQYRALLYNIICGQSHGNYETIVFYEEEGHVLTTWVDDLLYRLIPKRLIVHSSDYYEDRAEFKRVMKTRVPPRCVVIRPHKNGKITTQHQIDTFRGLGFKNIIVQHRPRQESPKTTAFKNYVLNNEALIRPYTGKHEHIDCWKIANAHVDEIFGTFGLLALNLLKWACCK